jgi:uncharacterized protein (TIGR02722 family)
MKQQYLSAFLVGASLALSACGGPKAVRGSDVEGLDDPAMSTGLDRRDLEKMLRENIEELKNSDVVRQWNAEPVEVRTVAVLPFRNDTSEHIDGALGALASDLETAIHDAGHVRLLTLDQRPELLDEVRRQNSGDFDKNRAAWGKQLGARYIVTGKIFSTDERQSGERRVQYFMFIQVLNVETGEILFQKKTSVTKAII